VDQTVRLFEAEGVPVKVEANGKIFPASDRSVDVLEALLRRLGRSGAEVRFLSPARSVEREGEGWRIGLPEGEVRARRIILAVGGRSYPGCGTTGDGYGIAKAFGHTIVEVRPALVPLKVVPEWVPTLRGLSLQDVTASVHGPSGPALAQRREAILFTHVGLSGPAILDVSRAEARRAEADRLELRIDFRPDEPREGVDRRLQEATRRGRASVASILSADLPHRLAECVLDHCAIPRSRIGPDLSRAERIRLVGALKGLALPIAGTLGFEKAEVCSGGVALEEVDPKTLESRLAPGFHLAGEVLDLDGLIGGYNFQAAWSTGWLAGESAAAAAGAGVVSG
jgi:predicted Rossmann fold flavoprotein